MSVPTPILQYNLSDASVKGLLPSGYTPLAYVEFTNANRLINTGITPNNNLKFESKWGNLTNGGLLYGSENSSDISSYASTASGYNWRWGGLAPSPTPVIDTGIFIVELSKDGIKINGVTKSTYSGTPSFTNTAVYLFGRSDNSAYLLTGKCYYFKIWNNGSLVRDFVPCINSSNVVGLYDLVGRLFYSPSSNVLKAGPELAIGKNGGRSLPEEYLLVEYLQMAPGLYINTGQAVAASDVTKTEAWMWYASGNTRDLMGWSTSAAEYWGCTAGSVWEKVTGVSPITQRQKVVYNYTATVAGTYQIGALTGGYSTRTKYIEQVKITIGGSLKRNLYACYRKSDGKPGMYDVVNGVFYTNAGSGEFILGPSITNCYTWEPNAGSGTLQGLYVNCNSIYDANKGWCLSGNDSTYSYVEFPKEVMNPLMTAKTFTIAFWFRVHNTNRHILFGSNSSYPLNIEYYTSGTKMRYYFIGAPDKMGSTAITTNTWYHVALCVTSTGFTAYINGNVDASHTSTPTFNQFTGNCRIGSDSRDTQIYLGSDILNFMIFNTALTAAQVKELYGK